MELFSKLRREIARQFSIDADRIAFTEVGSCMYRCAVQGPFDRGQEMCRAMNAATPAHIVITVVVR